MEQQPYYAACDKVGGIVDIKEPFHSLPASPFAVIAFKKRYGKGGKELYRGVYFIYKEEIHCGVYGDPDHHPGHLLLKAAPIGADVEYRYGRYAAPVGTEGYKALRLSASP